MEERQRRKGCTTGGDDADDLGWIHSIRNDHVTLWCCLGLRVVRVFQISQQLGVNGARNSLQLSTLPVLSDAVIKAHTNYSARTSEVLLLRKIEYKVSAEAADHALM